MVEGSTELRPAYCYTNGHRTTGERVQGMLR